MIRYRILPEHELNVLCLWDATSAHEILGMSESLRTDPAFSESYDTLVDNSRLESPLSGQEMRELATPRVHYMDSPTKVAIVAPGSATYGTSRMHQQLTQFNSPSEVGVFRDLPSALEWLGRDRVDLGDVCEEMRLAE
jgi:hypothetical protein